MAKVISISDALPTMTIAHVAELFGVDERTIRRWCSEDPGRTRPSLPRRSDGRFDAQVVILWAVAFRVDVAATT